jgi:succinate dehydrogenase / fumarate reductase membrane anchor subunit
MASFRTPLRRVRGLGSAKHGVGHFIAQRGSAVLLVILVLWAVASALGLARTDYTGAVLWMRSPINAIPTALLVLVSCFHMQLGMRVVVEDYIEKPVTKIVLLLANQAVAGLAAAVGVFSILKVAFGGGAF